MRHVRRMSVGAIGVVAAAALGLSACGSTTGSATPTTQPPHSPSTVSSATISGLGPVLTGSNGRTLYYLSAESSTSFQCTGGCTSTWHPYLVASTVTPTEASGVAGQVATTTRPEGTTQVTFNGHPVYFYQGDSAKGQANGQGISGVWYVLRTTAASGPPTSTTGPYGY